MVSFFNAVIGKFCRKYVCGEILSRLSAFLAIRTVFLRKSDFAERKKSCAIQHFPVSEEVYSIQLKKSIVPLILLYIIFVKLSIVYCDIFLT